MVTRKASFQTYRQVVGIPSPLWDWGLDHGGSTKTMAWRWAVYVKRPWERAASAIVSLLAPQGVAFSYLVFINSMPHTIDVMSTVLFPALFSLAGFWKEVFQELRCRKLHTVAHRVFFENTFSLGWIQHRTQFPVDKFASHVATFSCKVIAW